MTNKIKELIKNNTDFEVCGCCGGEGEVDYFCGHQSWESCRLCNGDGVTKKKSKK